MSTSVDTAVTTSLPGLVGADTQVPLLDGRLVQYANLDGAASAPALTAVAARVAEVLPWYASVHRGAGYLSQVCTSLYEASRQAVGDFVDARPDDVAIITRNTTDSINLLASVTPGRTLLLDLEHHANLLPWQRNRHGAHVAEAAPTVRGTVSQLAALLATESFALVAVTGASNVTGEGLPLDEIVALAHAHGTRVFVDGAQLLPHRRLSLLLSDVDYVALSGHKLYAPFGAGALVGRRDWLDAGEPYLAGGGAVRSVTVDDVQWGPAPARHEAGSPNVLGAVALAAACETLGGLDPIAVREHEDALRNQLLDGLATIPAARVARIWSDSTDATATVTVALGEADPGLLAAYLAAEHGIGVRDGKFCAHPLLARLGLPAGAVRVSIGLGTTAEHIDRLIGALRGYDETRARTRYQVVAGCWAPINDTRPLPQVSGGHDLAATAQGCSSKE